MIDFKNLSLLRKKMLRNKQILENFSYLGILQIFNLLIPFITYPYLIRVLGVDKFGVVAYAQAITSYLAIVVNFGFNISATKSVAESRGDLLGLNRVVSSIFTIKFFLWIACGLVYFLVIYNFAFFKKNLWLYVFSFGLTLNELIFPQWFFQGIEKMKFITVINVISKTIVCVIIFLTIKVQDDFVLLPAVRSLGFVISAGISFFLMVKNVKITFEIPKMKDIKYFFLESLPIFLSEVSVQLYVNANKVLVGSFLGMQEVAFYDLGEKIARLVKIPVAVLGQATFPKISVEKDVKNINKYLKIGLSMTLILVIFIYLFSGTIISLLGGDNMISAIPIVRILVLAPIFISISQFLGVSRLIVFGYKSIFTKIIATSGLFYLLFVLLLLLGESFSVVSVSWVTVFVEICVTLSMFLYCKTKKILA